MALAETAAAPMQRSHGEGALSVKAVDGRSRIGRLRQQANAKIRIPRTHGTALEAVLINTSGGIAGGDTLTWDIESGENTEAVLTTQACERVYRSTGETASVETRITVAENATMFWLPQETILFEGGRLKRTLDVSLATGATFVGLETLVFGREAMGETIERAFLHDRWRIRRGDALLHADDTRFDLDTAGETGHPAVLGANRCYATLVVCTPGDDETREALARRLRENIGGGSAGVSHVAGRIVARLAAPSAYAMRARIAAMLAPVLDGRPLPKVWNL